MLTCKIINKMILPTTHNPLYKTTCNTLITISLTLCQKETYPVHSAVAIVSPGPGTVPVTQTHSPCPLPRTKASPRAPLNRDSSYRTKYNTYKARSRQTLEQRGNNNLDNKSCTCINV